MDLNYPRNEQWFALRVKGRSEKVISSLLSDKGYPSFLPTYQAQSRRCTNTKRVDLPLFPGYVFCRFDVYRRLPILTTPGVLHIVSFGRVPAPVGDCEIASLQKAVEQRLVAQPSEYLQAGTKVRIAAGALCGIEGILLEVKNSLQLVLSVSLLCRSVRVEIPREFVVVVSPPALRHLREPAITHRAIAI
jgi:transcriptional antiterminator NusG